MTRTIGAGLPALAAAEPTRPALICDDRVLTREMLTARIAARAALLARRSAPGAPIALALGNGPELVDAFFACAISGRQALVYDPAWPAPYRAAIDAALVPAITLETLPDLALSTPAPFPPPPAPDAPFYVGFTSGSTGLPKGYRRSHRSWIDSFKVSAAAFGLSDVDIVLAPGGLAASLHLYGVVHALHSGATAVMMRQFHPRRALRLIARHGVTAIYATPTQLQMLIEAGGGERFPTVHLILISGAKWRAETRAATLALFPKAGVAEFYGASETSFITLALPEEAVPAGSVGRPAYGVTLRIRDASGRDLPAGAAGAIWVKSTMLFDAYACGDAPETRREGGFLTIGDHGRLDEAGFLYLHGREKRMLVTSGLNVYPEEVETVLVGLPGIEEAAVFGLPDALRGVELVAVLRGTFDEPTLRAACRKLLPAAKIPRRFLSLEDWPRTSGGKADLRALEAIARERLAR
jgi:long-chain acyl-CoA synthetase